MDYTPNFHLPQWEKDDRVMMEDFNQMASDLEAALLQNRQAAQNAQEGVQEVQTAARQGDAALAQKDAELSRLIAAAQQAADGAQQSANAAQTTADEVMVKAKEHPRIKMGGYLGRGGTVTVNMNCLPQIVFIAGKPSQSPLPESAYPTHKYSGTLLLEGPTVSGKVTTTGIEVTEINQADCPNLNAPNYWYNYVVLF